MSVNVRAPIRRRCALSLENAISIGLRSGLYGGKNKNQHPALRNAFSASAFLWEACGARMARCQKPARHHVRRTLSNDVRKRVTHKIRHSLSLPQRSTSDATKPFYSNVKGSNVRRSKRGACITDNSRHNAINQMSPSLKYSNRSDDVGRVAQHWQTTLIAVH